MIYSISLTFWTSVLPVDFLQEPGALEHTLGNVTLEALLFSLCVVSLVTPNRDVAKQIATDPGWRKASQVRLGPKCIGTQPVLLLSRPWSVSRGACLCVFCLLCVHAQGMVAVVIFLDERTASECETTGGFVRLEVMRGNGRQ